MVFPLVATLFYLKAGADELEVQMGRSSPESEDLIMEATPVRPHENVYIEDVEAQLEEAKVEAREAQKAAKKSDEWLKKVKAKNYGSKKHLQKQTIQALERKKAADRKRAKIEKKRERLQNDILAYEKRRIRAKQRAEKSADAVEKAKTKLQVSRQERTALGRPSPPAATKKRYRKVKVNFAEPPKTLASEEK